jgi:tetratricopeptide (TPR) repeat protein
MKNIPIDCGFLMKTILVGFVFMIKRIRTNYVLLMITIPINCVLLMTAAAGCASTKGAARYEADGHGERAYRYFLSGNMPGAVEQYKKGYASARKNDRVGDAAHALANIGRVFGETGQNDSAVLYLAKAHDEFVTLDDTTAASKTAAFLALCLAEQGDAGQARKWSQAAQAYNWKGSEHYHALMKSRLDMRLSSKITNESELDAAQTFYKKKKDYSVLTTILTLKADMEFSKGGCADAEELLLESLNLNDKAREPYRRSGILLKLSKIKFCTGDAAAGKHYYDRSKDCAPKGVKIPQMDEISECTGGCN